MTLQTQIQDRDRLSREGLYDPEQEHSACGVGFIANLTQERSHAVLEAGIKALECNDHRGGCNFDGVTGDGSGLMTQIPWELL